MNASYARSTSKSATDFTRCMSASDLCQNLDLSTQLLFPNSHQSRVTATRTPLMAASRFMSANRL